MTLGPPPSAAGPSGGTPPAHSTESAEAPTQGAPPATPTAALPPAPAPGPSISTGPYTTQFSVQPQPASRSYYTPQATNVYPAGSQTNPPHIGAQQGAQRAPSTHYPPYTNYYPQTPAQGAPQAQTGTYSYYNYPPNAWSNAWNTGTYQYGPGSSYPYSYAQPPPQQTNSHATAAPPPQQRQAAPPPPKKKTPTPSPSPSPPPRPDYHKDWDVIIKSFLSTIGFSQALKGFEADMIILNPEYERQVVPTALGDLMKDLLRLGQDSPERETKAQERPLEERKLDYVHLANDAKPRSHTSITKDISRFLARNRARNDASNRNEFLLSLAEKRRRLNENGDSAPAEPIPSCARTDAKTQNRDLQMKYDIAKNEDGPLRRTLKSGAAAANDASAASTSNRDANGASVFKQEYPSAERYPALDERLQNIEKHLAIRYVPSPPRSLLDRLKYLEDHIIHLEREYPPWAALHFNQPNRGWPPPPRPTPIIVPSHLTSTATRGPAQSGAPSGPASASATGQATPVSTTEGADAASKGKGKHGRSTKSSLHRAVMERLEVQKAIHDLTGGDGG